MRDNFADRGGGGLYAAGPLEVFDSLLVGNNGSSGEGAAVLAGTLLLQNSTVGGVPTLPLTTPLAVYVEGIPAEEAGKLGDVVSDPADADVAVVRLPAPFDPRDDLFLEGFDRCRR